VEEPSSTSSRGLLLLLLLLLVLLVLLLVLLVLHDHGLLRQFHGSPTALHDGDRVIAGEVRCEGRGAVLGVGEPHAAVVVQNATVERGRHAAGVVVGFDIRDEAPFPGRPDRVRGHLGKRLEEKSYVCCGGLVARLADEHLRPRRQPGAPSCAAGVVADRAPGAGG
jgi:hypothetical protein